MDLGDRVVLTDWRPEWAAESEALANRLKAALGPTALRIDHIGSTSVPGLMAKDVIDMQVIVATLDRNAIIETLTGARFVQKYAEWNVQDHMPAGWVETPGSGPSWCLRRHLAYGLAMSTSE